ncbi:MAG: GDP-mannose:cellobiosyl-diphosphopolyprenol alpha-mannosyltransferase [Candidatus Scalindua rubra]|uniref:GDP-mannose:cellobiosyl-diphosphopolyprenol alpha-mannosyltransferase n=1 Tax=Candidatus Scalindua rubra TaxID=1872076 RepID=A0A1E3X985_9BACT|nr:MAG: GDP-mannose:cellobiosyl-diphosphopolyprenol alpha-mannosyltransferase [Candidatus Scalindua rubra]
MDSLQKQGFTSLSGDVQKRMMNNKLTEGETLFAKGKIEEAEECFLSIVENGLNNKEVYNNLGVIAFQKEDTKKAIDYFTRSLEIDPLYRDAIVNYTNLLRTLNQLHIAVPLLEKIAEINPNDKEIIQLLEDIRSTPPSRSKIAILCLPGFESFLGNIVNFLKTKYEVRTCYTKDEQEIESTVEWADIVWLEWANEMAIYATSKVPSISQKKVLCRIHSYEVLRGYLPHTDWSKINMAIFVADHVKKIAHETYPSIANETKCLVIKNGVDLQKFSFKKREPGFNLAIAGDINYKKNPAMWVEIMNRLVKLNSQYTLKVAGDFQESQYKYYFENIIPRLGLEKNIKFFGRIKDIPEWFEKERINYLLTTSVFESFGYGIAEAMAMGYKPLIHNFPNADGIWPQNCIFSNTNELIEILKDTGSYNSQEYHEFVRNRYSLNSQLEAIESMMEDLMIPDIGSRNSKTGEAVPTNKIFGLPHGNSGAGIYLPQDYWEKRGNNYVVNKNDYDDGVEIPTLDKLMKKYRLYNSRILEVGSGYGRIYQKLGSKCSNFTMCDFSNTMRRECEKITGILPDYWNGHKSPYPDNSFDLVILFSVLLHVPDEQINNIFSEICRVAKDYVFITTYTGNLKVLAAHCFKHDYQKLFKENGLKVTFEKVINADQRTNFRTNWLVKKQPLTHKLESANVDLLRTTD